MKTNRTVVCPFCAEEIPASALACPHCGSDESTGWSEKKYLDGIDMPDDFSYEDTLAEEFPDHAAQKNKVKKVPWVAVVALILLVITFWGVITTLGAGR